MTLLYRDTPRPSWWAKLWGARDLQDEALKAQGCVIWCTCEVDLISSRSHTGSENDGAIELFTCTQCGEKSRWLFDAPVPIRLPLKREELTSA